MFLRRFVAPLSHSRRRLFSSNSRGADDFANYIAEFNQEMESVFGEAPIDGFAGSTSSSCSLAQEPSLGSEEHSIAQEPQLVSKEHGGNGLGLTHVGSTGEAQMVDVSPKESSKRTAIASCRVVLGKNVFDLVSANQMAKGDVLSVAKIAGITGAKQTSNLIPLCHNIGLTHVRVDLALNPKDYSVRIEGEASSTGKTGVEMEAMTAVTVAGLTVYDMCKAASKEIVMTDVKLEFKTGGKSGEWYRNSN